MSPKIAFCFLLKDQIEHLDIWSQFFKNANPNKYSIYAHPKFISNKLPPWIINNTIETIKTEWCGESLVSACVNMFKKALEDRNNKYFILVSGSCVPLYTFKDLYKIITVEKKSRIHSMTLTKKGESYLYADQWILLNRYIAKIFIEIENNYDLVRQLYYESDQISSHCPDEMYPILFLLERLNPAEFQNNINAKYLTYTKWRKGLSSPLKIRNEVPLEELCDSGALFARKFFKKSVKKFGMACKG